VSDATRAKSNNRAKIAKTNEHRECAKDLIMRIEDVENVSTEDFVYDTYPQATSRCKNEEFSRTRWSDQDNDAQSIGWDLSWNAEFVPL